MSGLVLSPLLTARIARETAAEAERDRREAIDREIARQDRREQYARDEEQFTLQHGYTRQELFAHMSALGDAREARDGGAEYGSRSRPALMVDGEVMRAREMTPERPRESEIDRLLARAKAVDTPFMRDQIRRYHERGAYGREISR